MPSILKKLLITILIISNSVKVFSEYTADSLLIFASKQYKAGNYDLAIKELLRVSFLMDSVAPEIQMQLADCYSLKGDWSNARLYYDQVYRSSTDANLQTKARFRKISSLISESNYKQALIDLYSINDSLRKKNAVEVNLLFAICHFGLEEFEKSENYFKLAVGDNEQAQFKIDSVFNQKKLFRKPNPALAYTLSLIIPGLGQVYAGDVGEGLNSFFLTEAFLVLGLVVSFEYSLIDAVVTILPWYQRYYLGGLDNSREIATNKRQMRRSEAYKKILGIVKETQQ